MSSYSVSKRLLHIVFGGSAIWLGTTFCSPLVATDFDWPVTPAVVPDTLDGTTSAPQKSTLPASSLEGVSHWDNGPVLKDESNNDDYACEEEFCWESGWGYDDAGDQEAYASDITEDVASESFDHDDDSWCYENNCCDEYAYDSYELDTSETKEVDGLVDLPEDAVYSDLETPSEDFGYDYGYDEMYAHDEYMDVDEGTQNDTEDDTCELADDFGYEDEWASEYEQGATEGVEGEQAANETSDDDPEMYEDYWYDEEYVYDYEDGYDDGYDESEMGGMDEQSAQVALTPNAEAQEAVEEEDFSYEFDDYEMYYGYEEESAELTEDVTNSEEIAEDATESQDSNWDDYYYGNEYESNYEEYESDSQPIAEEMATDEATDTEAVAEEAWADEYRYDSYEYDYYDYDYDMEGADAADAATDDPEDSWDQPYDYRDPMDQYGYEYRDASEWTGMEEDEAGEVALDLFAWQPRELLGVADRSLIQSIELLAGQSASKRRTCLNNYIEALGFEAIDFAYRYEDATDSDVLTLADDLPGAAAFLGCYRLVEQGKVGMDDGVLLLQDALSGLSLDWIEEVGRLAVPEEMASGSHPVVDALVGAANQSIASVTAITAAVSQQLADLPWVELEGRLEEIRSAFRPLGSDHSLTF